MFKLFRGLLPAFWTAAMIFAANAQTACPTIVHGAVLTAAQWNACFSAKQDGLGYIPLNTAGGTMTGRLTTAASTSAGANFVLPHGTAPSSPNNGDVWTTSAGFYARINGVTIGPMLGGDGGTVVASTPLTFEQTWNNVAVAFTAWKVNVTDTASDAASLLVDLQVGGSSKFNVDSSGNASVIGTLSFGTLSAASFEASPSTITGLTINSSPVAANDFVPYYSSANAGINRISLSNLVGSVGVSSIDAQTGSFTTANGITSTDTPNTVELTAARRTLPTECAGFSGSVCPTTGTGTYTTPANTLWIEVYMVGGGGGGGAGNAATAASNGGDTTFGASATAGGGIGGSNAVAGSGGTASSCTDSTNGSPGASGQVANSGAWDAAGGTGGNSYLGGGGKGGRGSIGGDAAANSGSGGGGGAQSTAATAFAGGGGGSGARCYLLIPSPSATYSFAIGSGGAPYTGPGTGGSNGGSGAAGKIIVIEHYGS